MSELFVIHSVETAPIETKPALEAARKRYGFLPNLLGELASAPPALNAYLQLGELFNQTSLSPVARQVVLVTASITNNCTYCVAAHTAGLKMAGLADDQIEAVRHGQPLADPVLDALRRFTLVLVDARGWVSEEQLSAFFAAGYSRANVLEVLVGIAMKTLSNYTNHLGGTPLDHALEPFAWARTAAH